MAARKDLRSYPPAQEPKALQALGHLLAKKFMREVDEAATKSEDECIRILKVWADLLVVPYGETDGRAAFLTYASLHGRRIIERPIRGKWKAEAPLLSGTDEAWLRWQLEGLSGGRA